MANKQRTATSGDMIRSMLVILIPVLLLVWLLTDNLRDYPVEQVEWRPVLQTARDTVDWPVQAPEGLPEGENAWVPTRVSFTEAGVRNHWRVGFLSPDEIYYEVNQGDGAVEPFVRDVTREGHRVGDELIEGSTWEQWESSDGRTRSLVLREDPTVTLVTADAEFIDLQQFARTLQAS